MNEEEYYQLVERHKDMLWSVCSDYSLGEAWEPCDAMQEVLQALWKSLPKLRSKESEKAWVYQVATNTMLMLVRKKHNRPVNPLPSDMRLRVADDSDMPTSNYQYLMQLIDLLSETDRRIVRAHLDGFKFKDIAPMLNMSEGAVIQRYHRAIKKLRQQYEYEI